MASYSPHEDPQAQAGAGDDRQRNPTPENPDDRRQAVQPRDLAAHGAGGDQVVGGAIVDAARVELAVDIGREAFRVREPQSRERSQITLTRAEAHPIQGDDAQRWR